MPLVKSEPFISAAELYRKGWRNPAFIEHEFPDGLRIVTGPYAYSRALRFVNGYKRVKNMPRSPVFIWTCTLKPPVEA